VEQRRRRSPEKASVQLATGEWSESGIAEHLVGQSPSRP